MKKLLLTLVTALMLLSQVSPTWADTVTGSGADPSSTASEATPTTPPGIPQADFLPGPSSARGDSLQDYVLNKAVPKAINIGIGLLALTAFLGILIAAIQMLTAYGDENKVSRGKTNLKYSIFGLVVVMMAYAIVSIVVSVALPKENDSGTSWLIPSAYAVDVENDPNILLPDVKTMIEDQDAQGRVSLPSGDFLGEIVPAVVTNIMYFVGFLIFIAFVYGGSIIVIGRGNEEDVSKAKNIILYSSIALGLISLGYSIIYGIATLNLNQDSSTNTDDLFIETQNE